MPKDFKNLAALIADLKGVQKKYKRTVKATVKATGKAIQKDAKALFGTYQEGWAPLAESTQAARAKAGHTPNDPLLVTGALRDAMTVKVDEDGMGVFVGMEAGTAVPGARVDAAVLMGVHEYGSTNGRIAARPVFGIIANRIDAHAKAAEDKILKGLDL